MPTQMNTYMVSMELHSLWKIVVKRIRYLEIASRGLFSSSWQSHPTEINNSFSQCCSQWFPLLKARVWCSFCVTLQWIVYVYEFLTVGWTNNVRLFFNDRRDDRKRNNLGGRKYIWAESRKLLRLIWDRQEKEGKCLATLEHKTMVPFKNICLWLSFKYVQVYKTDYIYLKSRIEMLPLSICPVGDGTFLRFLDQTKIWSLLS